MSHLWQQFAALIAAGDVRISEHGYDALADDGLTVDDILLGIGPAIIVDEYPDYPKGAVTCPPSTRLERIPPTCSDSRNAGSSCGTPLR